MICVRCCDPIHSDEAIEPVMVAGQLGTAHLSCADDLDVDRAESVQPTRRSRMLRTPYSLMRIEDVKPGQRIDREGEPFVVDETRMRFETIDLLGWPLHRNGNGRRATVTAKVGTDVRILPSTAGDYDELRQALVDAIGAGVAKWDQDQLAATTGGDAVGRIVDVQAAPWSVEAAGTTVRLQVRGRFWLVDFEPAYDFASVLEAVDEEPEPDPDEDDDDGEATTTDDATS